jgi:hypothetical protein
MGLYAAQSKAETVFFSRGGVSVCCRLSQLFGVLSYGVSRVLGGGRWSAAVGWSPLVGRRWLVAVGRPYYPTNSIGFID